MPPTISRFALCLTTRTYSRRNIVVGFHRDGTTRRSHLVNNLQSCSLSCCIWSSGVDILFSGGKLPNGLLVTDTSSFFLQGVSSQRIYGRTTTTGNLYSDSGVRGLRNGIAAVSEIAGRGLETNTGLQKGESIRRGGSGDCLDCMHGGPHFC